jgi:hypothetical protein
MGGRAGLKLKPPANRKEAYEQLSIVFHSFVFEERPNLDGLVIGCHRNREMMS